MASGFPPKADTVADGRHVSKMPEGDLCPQASNEDPCHLIARERQPF
jgi:hypothetical protein